MKRLIITIMVGALVVLAVGIMPDGTAATKTWTTDADWQSPEVTLDNLKVKTDSLYIGTWGYPGFGFKKEVLISGGATALTDYPIKMAVTYNANMKSDFSDIRFTDGTHKIKLLYWIESKVDGSSADVWVKAPSIPTSGAKIYMYYGNASAVSASNEEATTIFVDNFDDYSTTAVTEKGRWTVGQGTWSVENKALEMKNPGNPLQANWIKANVALPSKYVIRTKMMNLNGGAQNTADIITHQNSGSVGDFYGVGMRPLAYIPPRWVSQKMPGNYYGAYSVTDGDPSGNMVQGVFYIVTVAVEGTQISLEAKNENGTARTFTTPTSGTLISTNPFAFKDNSITWGNVAGVGSPGGLGRYDDFKVYSRVSTLTVTFGVEEAL